MRQAMLYALDRESIVNDILLGYAEVAQGTQPVISYAYAPDRSRPSTPTIRSKAQLACWPRQVGPTATATASSTRTVSRFPSSSSIRSGSPTSDQLVAYMQDAWAEIGVEATPRSLEFAALIEATTTDPNFEVALYGFSWDATFIQDAMFGCDQYQVGFNDMKYCNPELDEINDAGEADLRRRGPPRAADRGQQHRQRRAAGRGPALLAGARCHTATALQNYIPSTWGVDLSYVWIQQ